MASADIEFNSAHLRYKDKIDTLVNSLRRGLCVAFIKDGYKYVLRILSVTITQSSNNATKEIQIVGTGAVWRGGYFCVDKVDAGGGISAGGYTSSISILDELTPALWQDEFSTVSYLAFHSQYQPITITGAIQSGTSNLADDIWELIVISAEQYTKIIRDIQEYVIIPGRFRVVY